jgi:ribonuclease BN (tRNA processing enzyme)
MSFDGTDMAEIFFLGTGGSLATGERDNTAFLLRAGGSCALIDCPGSVVQKIIRSGVRPLDVTFLDCSAASRFFIQYPALATKHTSALALGEWSERARVRTLVPCHFLAELDFPVAEAEAEIRAGFSGRLVLPADLEGFVLA